MQLLLPNNVSSFKDLLDFYLCMSVCAMCVCVGVPRGQKRALDPLELELQVKSTKASQT